MLAYPNRNAFYWRVSRKPKRQAPKSNEKDIRLVYRRREEATELLGFHVTPRTYGRRAGQQRILDAIDSPA
jgi:hypothetical protein